MAKKISALGAAQPLAGDEKLPAAQAGQTVSVSPQQLAAFAAPTALKALALAAVRRVDMVMIGDSNQLMGGYGFAGGFTKALVARFGLYATPAYGGTAGYLNNQGNPASFSANSLSGASTTGLSATLEALAMPPLPGGGANTYAHLASGSGSGYGAASINGGVAGVNAAARWRGWFSYATFASGSGGFTFGARMEQAPYTGYGTRAAIATNAGAEGRALDYFDLAANPARAGVLVGFKWSLPGGTAVTGPWAGYWSRAENLDAEGGVCVHTLYGVGGQSLYDMAAQLNAWSMAQLTSYFGEIRRLQVTRGQKPIVVVYLNSGLNDRNETTSPSLGWRQSAAPASTTAFLDNLEAIVGRIEAVWAANGWDRDELHWLLMPSHPVADPDDAVLTGYRAIAKGWAERRQADPRLARVTMIDLTTITTATEMLANGWYASSGNDRNHLTVPGGYDALAARVVARIQ